MHSASTCANDIHGEHGHLIACTSAHYAPLPIPNRRTAVCSVAIHCAKISQQSPHKFFGRPSPSFLFTGTKIPLWMDADAYLRKQGWKGTGHSLDGQGRGIRKPLLIAHKQDQLGLGKKKAAHSVDDQWWMRAFDQSLQNIGTGKEV